MYNQITIFQATYIIFLKSAYKSALTPKPGPVGGLDNDVGSPNGSAAYLPLLGPAAGFLPAFSSSNISSISFTVKSS